MVLSAYQINNVLRVYKNQLHQNKISSKSKDSTTPSSDKISISAEAKRKAVIDKISTDVIEKITQYGPHDKIEEEVFQKLENEYEKNLAITKNGSTELIFKEIDEHGETINSLSVEDSQFLRHKIKEIAKETVKNNMI
ncbi:MAG: DVU0524 family FlgM-associated protein [Thermodesulfobacteriota bacterium]